jgi:hypothetical protein
MNRRNFLIVALALVGGAYGQGFRVSVDDPRPLWKAIRTLEEKRGWAISYEDPQYSGSDLVDRTAASYSGPSRALMPRGGRVEVDFTGTETPAASVQQLIADHHRSNRSGEFNAQTIGQMLVVAPAQGSPLDSAVSLAPTDRTLDELLRELAHSLTQLSPLAVHEPGMLVGSSQRFAFSASNEPARSVLARALLAASSADTRHPVYVWDLLFAPNFGFVLNVHTTKQMVKVPDGGSKLIQVESRAH